MRPRVGGVKAMCPSRDMRRPRPDSPIPPPPRQRARHTAGMAIRYAVQADTRDECVEGLEQLVQLDLVPVMLPVQVGGDRWMARAVPRPPARVEDTPRT